MTQTKRNFFDFIAELFIRGLISVAIFIQMMKYIFTFNWDDAKKLWYAIRHQTFYGDL